MATECVVCGLPGCADAVCESFAALANAGADKDERELTAWWWRRQRAGRCGEEFTEEPPVPQWLRALEVDAAILQARLDERGRDDAA